MWLVVTGAVVLVLLAPTNFFKNLGCFLCFVCLSYVSFVAGFVSDISSCVAIAPKVTIDSRPDLKMDLGSVDYPFRVPVSDLALQRRGLVALRR